MYCIYVVKIGREPFISAIACQTHYCLSNPNSFVIRGEEFVTSSQDNVSGPDIREPNGRLVSDDTSDS